VSGLMACWVGIHSLVNWMPPSPTTHTHSAPPHPCMRAGTPYLKQTSCYGDSGGPLFIKGKDSSHDTQVQYCAQSWSCYVCFKAGRSMAWWGCPWQSAHACQVQAGTLPLTWLSFGCNRPDPPLQVGIVSFASDCGTEDPSECTRRQLPCCGPLSAA